MKPSCNTDGISGNPKEAARALRAELNAAATVIQALYAENVSLREKLARLQKKNVPKLGR